MLPTERLPRSAAAPVERARQPDDAHGAGPFAVAAAMPEYRELFARHLDGHVAPARAPVPDDLAARTRNLKASAYFLDATLAGVCETTRTRSSSSSSREPRAGEPGAEWIGGRNAARTNQRSAEVAVVLAGYVRALGWSARAHVAGDTLVDLEGLAQRAGLAKAVDGVLAMPFSKRGFRIGVMTTDYPLEPDLPLAPDASLDWPDGAAYVGAGGTRPGFEDAELAARPAHLGRYPMERIRRVDKPTTLVLRDEIWGMPKRADLFTRALAGDLGA